MSPAARKPGAHRKPRRLPGRLAAAIASAVTWMLSTALGVMFP